MQVEGLSVPALAPFDELLTNFITRRHIERASLAISRNGRPVFARAYTWAPSGTLPTFPTNLFRIASISKPITAVAIMQLVQDGKLDLDAPIGSILDLAHASDPRMKTVTVRQLLQHRGGWDSSASFDPMFHDFAIVKALGRSLPTTPMMVIDYMKTRPLDFDPGSRYAYSNFGYCLLGRIIESVTGQTYEAYVQRHLLEPIGINDMRIGRSLLAERLPAEVNYEDPLNRIVRSVMSSGTPAKVPVQYGGWNLATMDAHGGWVASALDLVRFASAFDVITNSPLLRASTITTMWARPSGETNSTAFYANGWSVRVLKSGAMNTWHNGSLAGSTTLLVHRWDRLNWALLLNRREPDDVPGEYLHEIDPALHGAAAKVTAWPTPDLAN